MPYTEAQKRATYKWREQNRERVYELNKPLQQRYYLENKEKCSIESKLRYQYKKECKRMRDILFDKGASRPSKTPPNIWALHK